MVGLVGIDPDLFKTDLAGNNRKELVGASIDEVTWTLNGPGKAKISVDPLHADALLLVLNEIELQIWLNGVYSHCVIPRGVGGDTQRLTFECEGLLSELEYAYLATPPIGGVVPQNTPLLHWTGQDQHDILVMMIDWWQTQTPSSDLRIESGAYAASGIWRSRTIYEDAYESLWDVITEFSKLHEGPDFDLVLYGDGRREFWPYTPGKGTLKPQYSLQLDQRGRKYVQGVESWKESAVDQATEVYNTGGNVTQDNPDPEEDEQLKVVGYYHDQTAAGSPKYRRKTKIISSGQIIDLGWLNDRAEQEELIRGQAITTGNLVVDESLLGLVVTGDTLPVNVDYGRLKMKGNFRIMELTWRKDPGNILLSMQPE